MGLGLLVWPLVVALNYIITNLRTNKNADTARLADQYLEQFTEALDSGDWN